MKAVKPMIFVMIIISSLFIMTPAYGRIKLVSLPERADTIIRLENRHATLIEEERVLTLQKGINHVDFSWKGVSIDSDSIRLSILSHPDQVTLLNVSYPPGEEALVWEISSKEAWEERVRVSYLLNNIDSLIAYKVIADMTEQYVDFKGNLILRNFSGEDFETARIHLGFGNSFQQKILHEETQQQLLFEASKMPVEKILTFNAAELPWDPERSDTNVGIPVSYRIQNIDQHGLGSFGLPDGKVRVFQHDGYGGAIFLGEDQISYVPVGETAEFQIGASRDIVVTQRKMRDNKINIRRNQKNQVVLYDTDEQVYAKIENFKNSPVLLTMIQKINGQWVMESCNMDYHLKDAYTLEFEIQLSPGEKKELTMTYQRRNIRGRF